jgi:P-type E1-E2 ATPase
LIRLQIPGWGTCELEHLVLDLNGTVALDGQVIPGVSDRLVALAAHLEVHLVSADTRGQAEETSKQLGCQLVRIEPRHEASQKRALVERLGAGQDARERSGVAAIGNGVNDARMLSVAALGIAVLGPEGLAVETLRAGNVVVARIEDALDLLIHPQRLVATLRR